MKSRRNYYPKARREQLVVRELPDEVLIYDLVRDKAHCLNKSAAAIWLLCDGKTSPTQIAKKLEKQLGNDVRVIWLALEELGHKHLLDEKVEWPSSLPPLGRREAMRRIGLGAAIAIPLVTSIISPTPAQAATCLAHCSPCSTGSQCCSGVCASSPPGCSGMRCV
jgi:hypothetical protein